MQPGSDCSHSTPSIVHTGLQGYHISKKTSTTIRSTKYDVYITKNILFKTSFEYESNGIIFVTYILYFVDQICSQMGVAKRRRRGGPKDPHIADPPV